MQTLIDGKEAWDAQSWKNKNTLALNAPTQHASLVKFGLPVAFGPLYSILIVSVFRMFHAHVAVTPNFIKRG